MEYAHLFTGSRWEILEELARKSASTTALAKKLGTSPAHVSQQLRQLELAGVVSKKRNSRGSSHYAYSISSSSVHAVVLGPHTALKYSPRMSTHQQFLIAIALSKHADVLLGFLLSHPELYKQLRFIGILKRDSPELFVVADDVKHIREHYANKEVETIEGTRRAIVWSHTAEEVKAGLLSKEDYYMKLLHDTYIVYDPQDIYLAFTDIVEDNQ